MIITPMKMTMSSSYLDSHDKDGDEDDYVKFLFLLP